MFPREDKQNLKEVLILLKSLKRWQADEWSAEAGLFGASANSCGVNTPFLASS